MEYLENIDLAEVKARALRAKKFAEENAPAIIVGLLAVIALIAFISLLVDIKKISELKKLRSACKRSLCFDIKDCDFSESESPE
jgi:hypothetical protein